RVAGPRQAVHRPHVAHVVLTSRRVDPRDPEPTKLTLPLLTVTVRVLPPPLDRVLRDPPELRPGAPVPLRRPQILLLLVMARDRARTACHGSPSQHPLDPRLVRLRHQARLPKLPLPLRRLLREDMTQV